jgi:hypothetical protein
MDDGLTRTESDELSEFMEHIELLERLSPPVARLERWELYRLTGAEIAIKEAVELLMEEFEGEKDSWLLELKNVPEAVSRVLQKDGDKSSFEALIELIRVIIERMVNFVTIASLSDVIG